MVKVLRHSKSLEMGVLVGIDPDSDGLARARRFGVPTTAQGTDGLVRMHEFDDVELVFDATSATAHKLNAAALQRHGRQIVDLTPAAIGPYVVPVVNLEEHLDAPNINMVSCGGQATIPIVSAVSQVARVHYAEIVASIASKSAGPGTRANIDEFTRTTAHGLEVVGRATHAKAIIVLNPAEPPLIMRDTVFCLSEPASEQLIAESIAKMVALVQRYVPGYRLKQEVQFENVVVAGGMPGPSGQPALKITVLLEVEGAGHYLPPYAGNLDIMTSAALATGERLALKSEQRYAHL
jgi:acetaldehyde dehydrogenase